MRQIIIGVNEAGQRMDKMLAKYLKEAPKSFLYKMLRKKNITLNGKKASGNEILNVSDEVKLFLSEQTIEKFLGSADLGKAGEILGGKQLLEHMPKIVYEDTNVLLLNKPVGMLSQKAAEADVSIIEYLLAYLMQTKQLTREDMLTFRPSICNRLDRNTSGLIAAGKSLAGLQQLSQIFKDRSLGKYYLCLVKGIVRESCHLNGYLSKNRNTNQVQITKTARQDATAIETAFRPIQAGEGITLLEVHLITGKTHQIRAHLASMAHPIIGDAKYGDSQINQYYKKIYGLQSQLLHSYRLIFPHIEGQLSNLSNKEFRAELPELFRKIAVEKGVL